MNANATTRFVRLHYRAHERAMQKQMTHLFVLYRTCEEMRRELGDEGLRHWMRVHCPEIPWADFKQLFASARSASMRRAVMRVTRASNN